MELLTRYLYNSKKYNSTYELRQAIFEKDRIAFGEFTPELMKSFGITEEKYDPIDEMPDEQVAQRVRARRDTLLAESDFYVQPDYPSTSEGLEAVKTYRQTLRDITEQRGFPRGVTWPEVPSVLKTGESMLKLAKVGI